MLLRLIADSLPPVFLTFPLLEQFGHLLSMLSETDPQLADEVRKQLPV